MAPHGLSLEVIEQRPSPCQNTGHTVRSPVAQRSRSAQRQEISSHLIPVVTTRPGLTILTVGAGILRCSCVTSRCPRFMTIGPSLAPPFSVKFQSVHAKCCGEITRVSHIPMRPADMFFRMDGKRTVIRLRKLRMKWDSTQPCDNSQPCAIRNIDRAPSRAYISVDLSH